MFLRTLIVLLSLAVLIGGLAYLKYTQIQAEMAMSSQPMPPSTVSAATVTAKPWLPRINAVGNVQAVQGVMVNNQVAGQVERILFDSGDQVRAGQALVQLDTEVDEANLVGLEASRTLARTQLNRNRKLLADRAVSRGDFDEISAKLEQATAAVQSSKALIEKKTIRAPFGGQLGIRQVNLGQYLAAGSEIVALEALDPVYVDYALPERNLAELHAGQPVEVTVAAYPGRVFPGAIQAVSPAVNRQTRNIQIRALLRNPERLLRPGMFAKIATLLPEKGQVLTLPRQAITFNTYGDSVFLILDGEGDQTGKLIVQRRQITTGAVRDQEVEVRGGLAAGDRVVSAGQVKLRNDAEVSIVPDDGSAAEVGPADTGGAAPGTTPDRTGQAGPATPAEQAE
ncbi:MAG: efflux RND transporter periplasmic adaptor subunit [Chromatiaceae bacterium]|nr:efflux RND transporter periplasmic adaptor subunit [Chromatiaceae bacterium]